MKERSIGQPYEPVAIIGMACRFPGAADLSSFWRLLEEGGNAVIEGEPGSGVGRIGELFPDPVEPEACRFGAYIEDLDLFDPAFFRISPVEAELLDPQQRMMLEVCWQALEDAGINPDGLGGSRTGVYTGISNMEYRPLTLNSSEPDAPASSLYALTGTTLNSVSGRVSYVLGLEGPTMAVDAACSSSLVAVHQAIAGLQRGDSDLALAGGVQAVMDGRAFEVRAISGMLSPDGQCKAFDASANGFVRGEGCGMVVLKRLSQAVADGDRIWGVIRGSAVNHVGTSAGLTVPHGPAQKKVIEEALSQARINPADVDYLEAHGTGTEVGDPIEIDAAVAVYGTGRDPDRPLLVGSVKTNIGHLEPASGIAGLIKTILAIQRGVIPKQLHFHNPNPRVDWPRLPITITSEPTKWPRRPGRPFLAGVSSYGISGTNAHVVVEGYGTPDTSDATIYGTEWAPGPPREVSTSSLGSTEEAGPAARGLHPRQLRFLPMSGKTDGALKDLANLYLSHLDKHVDASLSESEENEALADMAWTAGSGRSHFPYRAGVPFRDAASLRNALAEVASWDSRPQSSPPRKVAFVYTGQGSQWVGMGRELYETERVAREIFDRCEVAFLEERGKSLLDVMFGLGDGEDLSDTAWEQPALYALESALTAMWASVGIWPDVVVGHSVGELAACQAAGVFSLEDGMRLAARRGTLLSNTEPGSMLAVFSSVEQVSEAVEAVNTELGGVGLSLAADNGTHLVVSGPTDKVDLISERLELQEVRIRRLNTSRAFHSALMEPAMAPLEAFVNALTVAPPTRATLVSNVTGRVVGEDEVLGGSYWSGHARAPVAFASGVKTLAELGVDAIVEIGPHSVLGPMASLCWPEPVGDRDDAAPAVLASLLRPPRGEIQPERDFVEAVAAAYESGMDISFAGLFSGEMRRRVSVPSYPFQRTRHWVSTTKRRRSATEHALLGARHESARGEVLYESEISPADPAWLPDHRVFGRIVAPGALYAAMAVSASLNEGEGPTVIEDMQLHSPLIFPEDSNGNDRRFAARRLQLVLGHTDEQAARRIEIFSKGAEERWTLHVEGSLSAAMRPEDVSEQVDLRTLKAGLSSQDVPEFFEAKSASGLEFGPAFRGLEALWCSPGEALGEIALPGFVESDRLDAHPLLIDGCFQVMSAARQFIAAENTAAYMPFGWERMWLTGGLPDRIVCHAKIRNSPRENGAVSCATPEVVTADLWLYSSHGVPLGALIGYSSKRATRSALLSAIEGMDDLFYEIVWRQRDHQVGLQHAGFLQSPRETKSQVPPFSTYLTAEGMEPGNRVGVERDLDKLAQAFALASLERLGWERRPGDRADAADLLASLGVLPQHQRLMERLLEMLAASGVVEANPTDGWVVSSPEESGRGYQTHTPEELAAQMSSRHSNSRNELELLRRCGSALADVLQGRADPLEVLFGGEPSAGDLYRNAPAWLAANRMLGDAVAAAVSRLPEGRRLRVLEVGAGTGSATEMVLPQLPKEQFEYCFTDLSAGFFGDAEQRYGSQEGRIQFRVLNIETDPVSQGFDSHGYDLVIAANVLHATRDLGQALLNCRTLLAPQGQLVALEGLRRSDWRDMIFGLVEGWWRFEDSYRPDHALAPSLVWHRALDDAGFVEVEVLGGSDLDGEDPDRGAIVAQGPELITDSPGVWILAEGDGEIAADLAVELANRNQTVVLARERCEGGDGPPASAGVIRAEVDAWDRESWRELVNNLPEGLPLRGVVHLAALQGNGTAATISELEEDLGRITDGALALVQGLTDADAQPEKGLWLVTMGSQVLGNEPAGELAGATLWGFGRVVMREAPQLQGRMIDLDPTESMLPKNLVDELLYPDSENQIAYRGGDRLVARLVRSDRRELPSGGATGIIRDDRTYLVTGGLGGIGCEVADWMAGQGAGAIVLNGRRPPRPGAEEVIAALRARGANVHVELADVTDDASVRNMLARMDATLPPLAGVIHSVGLLSDGALTNQTRERFQQVIWPKVLGAWRLHRATEGRDLDLFILFSSMSGVRGNQGQANYAAANAFLDQLAAHRRAVGLPGQAIQWGAWAGVGEAEEQRERIEDSLAAFGSGWMTPQQGIRALDRLVRQNPVSTAVASMYWPAFASSLARPMPFIEELLPKEVVRRVNAPAPSSNLLSRLRETPAEEREALLLSFLQGELQSILRLPSPAPPTVGFFELGMDSLMAVDFRSRLNRALSGEYTAPNTIVFDYPDTASLARHLAGALTGSVQVQPERRASNRLSGEHEHEGGIAIVGMACRFPGADDLEAYWRLLDAGESAVSDDRPESGHLAGLGKGKFSGNSNHRRGAYIKGIDQFDAAFFRIAPIEARNMDPQQRLLLETSWRALEDAGIDPDRLRGSRTGVYAGIGNSEYRDLMRDSGNGVSYLGTSASMAVGRVSFVLGLEGPAIPVELACASSLAAVHQAMGALQQGEVDMALAGGVNVVLSEAVTREMTQIGMLSSNGECRTFDADADGYVRGEGCGMVVLKRLGDAEADGDHIWGVILGSAVNQNGASAGPTAPNGPAQERVIEEAILKAGVEPRDVDYLEAHGVGSNLGDPIEVQAAAAVYGRNREKERPLLIGSVKTNIGHLEIAAGIAALIKSVLAMNYRVIPKHLNFENPTPHLNWDDLPVRVASESVEWSVDSVRTPLAAVSAFGVQGANAHLVVEGYQKPGGEVASSLEGKSSMAGPARYVQSSLSGLELPEDRLGNRITRLLPISGKSPKALRDLANEYLTWLGDTQDANTATQFLGDMAWTASVGRSHFAHRAGVVFRDLETLRDGLNAVSLIDQEQGPAVAPRIAFRYAGLEGTQFAASRELYDCEPVACSVLMRCEEVFQRARGVSLLDTLLGRNGGEGDLSDPAWGLPALYALECALTAMCSSAGIRPGSVAGRTGGELAAAQATGVLGIEDGMRLAATRELSSLLEEIPQEVTSGDPGVDLVLEITPDRTFSQVVAMAYEAGADISFTGLFAGESRRRISVPGYPFQRRSYWIEAATR